MKRKYTVKITPKLLKTLKKHWKMYREISECYHTNLFYLEKWMEKDTGIKGIEFFRNDGYICGIGDFGLWTMPLVTAERLEK